MPDNDAPLPIRTHLAASSLAAAVARLATHPLDTLKTRKQAGAARPYSVLLRAQPLRSLYAGLPISLALSVPAVSAYLLTYDYAKRALTSSGSSQLWPPAAHALAAAAAECVSGVLWTPMEVVKTNLQVSPASSTLGVAARVYAQHGVRGFFRGYGVGLAVFVPYTVTFFVAYEELKEAVSAARQAPLTPGEYCACAGISAAAGALVSNGMDVVKTRWVLLRPEGGGSSKAAPTPRKSLPALVRDVWRAGAARGVMRGLLARTLWVVPNVAIGMTVYEVVKARLRARAEL